MLADGTPMTRDEVLKLGLVRFKGAPFGDGRDLDIHGGHVRLTELSPASTREAFSATAENLGAE